MIVLATDFTSPFGCFTDSKKSVVITIGTEVVLYFGYRTPIALAIAWVVVAIGLAADGLKEYLEP